MRAARRFWKLKSESAFSAVVPVSVDADREHLGDVVVEREARRVVADELVVQRDREIRHDLEALRLDDVLLLHGVDLGVDRLLGLDAEVDLLAGRALRRVGRDLADVHPATAGGARVSACRRSAGLIAARGRRGRCRRGRASADRRPCRPERSACRPPALLPEAVAALPALGFFFCAYAACGSSTKAAASRSHLRACFIATPSASFEALSAA